MTDNQKKILTVLRDGPKDYFQLIGATSPMRGHVLEQNIGILNDHYSLIKSEVVSAPGLRTKVVYSILPIGIEMLERELNKPEKKETARLWE